MSEYEYTITVTSVDDILSRSEELSKASGPRVLYCDSDGECFFDRGQEPYVGAIIETLNGYGEQGWSLVQVVLRQQDMIGFWKRRKEA